MNSFVLSTGSTTYTDGELDLRYSVVGIYSSFEKAKAAIPFQADWIVEEFVLDAAVKTENRKP